MPLIERMKPGGIQVVHRGDRTVVILHGGELPADEEKVTRIGLTPEGARLLAVALIEHAHLAEAEAQERHSGRMLR